MNHICLTTENLGIGYHSRRSDNPLISELNICLQTGKLTCLIGQNGIGKSTLLRTLAGLQSPVLGKIFIAGRMTKELSNTEIAREISVVLTDPVCYGDLHVEQVVELGRIPYTNWLGILTDDDRRIVHQAIQRVGASHLLGRSFSELSDGERQKIMIARALAQRTKVMILDEPTAFLDWPNRVDLLINLKQIANEENKAVLISSHDLELVLQIADEIWLLAADKSLIQGRARELMENGTLQKTFSSRHGNFLPFNSVLPANNGIN